MGAPRRRSRFATAVMLGGILGMAIPFGGGAIVTAEGSGLPEMCSGRHDPSTTVIAGLRGTTTSPKYVLNVSSDDAGIPTGVLVFERDGSRLYVDQFCRVWQHLPGQEPGPCMMDGTESEGAITAHAVGIGSLQDGATVLVRTDVRQTEEGRFFRLRWKPMGVHEDGGMTAAMEDGGGCEEGAWVRYPSPDETSEEEAWAILDRLMVKVGAVE